MLDGKKILLGVTSSIAAYKSAYLTRLLIKSNAEVKVAMTKNATEFITPLTFETLTGQPVVSDMFENRIRPDIGHISWAKWADLIIVAPATANIIAKAANGIADDFLSTTILASNAPVLFAPAMNSAMYENSITQDNIAKLKKHGHHFVTSDEGFLACGDKGSGRLAELNHIQDMAFYLMHNKPLNGTKAVVTAGATREFLDPVRFLSNPSTGLMGFEIARYLKAFGANVTLISGKSNIARPYGVKYIETLDAQAMFQEVQKLADDADIFVSSAAVSDWTPSEKFDMKRKKDGQNMQIELKRTNDILYEVGKSKNGRQIIVGFALETDNLLENAKNKLEEKNLDLIIANPQTEKSGFEVMTNRGHIIHRTGRIENVDMTTKHHMAGIIADRIYRLYDDKKAQ
ncbi:MAG: bifunctional phosphopantothenoylcysteine decarboxylase/phosphopantothenate--cysteine ligase CoaBC [Candidatus Zixiibacteriota bacterium]